MNIFKYKESWDENPNKFYEQLNRSNNKKTKVDVRVMKQILEKTNSFLDENLFTSPAYLDDCKKLKKGLQKLKRVKIVKNRNLLKKIIDFVFKKKFEK